MRVYGPPERRISCWLQLPKLFARVTTVESFLLSQKARNSGALGLLGRIASPRLNNAVITIDEWGLLSNRAGHALLAVARANGADVRFVGDTSQHVGVEAGDFGRTLEEHSKLRSVSVSKI